MPEPTVLCTICARGGSKGVPKKNLRPLGEKPLIAHTIDDAHGWDRAEDIVVSTDSEEIADVAREFGARVPFIRPAELATDDAPKLPVIQHALDRMEDDRDEPYDYVVDLGVAAPLRDTHDIEKAFKIAREPDVNNVYTVTEAQKNPYFSMVELDVDGYAHLSKEPDESVDSRQNAPSVYDMNGSIYVYKRDFLVAADSIHSDRSKVSIMPPERSVDIDRPIDLAFARFIETEWKGNDS